MLGKGMICWFCRRVPNKKNDSTISKHVIWLIRLVLKNTNNFKRRTGHVLSINKYTNGFYDGVEIRAYGRRIWGDPTQSGKVQWSFL